MQFFIARPYQVNGPQLVSSLPKRVFFLPRLCTVRRVSAQVFGPTLYHTEVYCLPTIIRNEGPLCLARGRTEQGLLHLRSFRNLSTMALPPLFPQGLDLTHSLPLVNMHP